jgi:RND family efflux transporter MFP subunit
MRIAILLCVALTACRKDEPPAPARPPAAELPATEVVVAKRGTVEVGPQISGTLEPARSATVSARVGGTVRAIGPELGERVAAGALLARIDPGPLGAAAASAKAGVTSAQRARDVAQRELERARALVEAGAVPRREVEQAEARLAAQDAAIDQARAQLAAAAQQLGDTTVRAPIAGLVARRSVNTGDVVAPGGPLYQIIDPSSIRLAATVPSDQASAVAPGKRVRFTVRGRTEPIEGAITRVAPAVDPATRQVPILVEIPNTDLRLLSGLFAQGRIVAESASGLALPLSAIARSADGKIATVQRLARGAIERVPVTLGLVDPLRDVAIVTAGLTEGDRVARRASASAAP